ncbi:MAG: patatin-like phospholipase family protein [Bauldia sp.]|nr:patatin-like phospholipase family protein [Bauldia sp.]
MTRTILALDGGGVRGVVSIAFLERVEALLSEGVGRPVRLHEAFDLIGGTSTGAIIATALALGMPAAEVRDLYFRLAPKVFRKARFRLPGFAPIFDAARLKEELVAFCGDETLASPRLLTGLAVVAKRVDTASAWLLTNNPRARYWDDPPDGSYIGNRHFRIADTVRASAAAPHYFAPEPISVADGAPPGLFIDGGVTAHNNPSLALLQIATIPAYGYAWPTGADELLIISVGTGFSVRRIEATAAARMRPIFAAGAALIGMIDEIGRQVLTQMQLLGRTDTPWRLNSEVDDLGGFVLPAEPLFTFQRYDLRYDAGWLASELGLSLAARDLERLPALADPGTMPLAHEIATAAAARFVRPEHLRLAVTRLKQRDATGPRPPP